MAGRRDGETGDGGTAGRRDGGIVQLFEVPGNGFQSRSRWTFVVRISSSHLS